MVRQAHHERNQQLTVRPELVEGLIQSFLNRLEESPPSPEKIKAHCENNTHATTAIQIATWALLLP
jgi:hypothetical protein